jgi:hypothetical protein
MSPSEKPEGSASSIPYTEIFVSHRFGHFEQQSLQSQLVLQTWHETQTFLDVDALVGGRDRPAHLDAALALLPQFGCSEDEENKLDREEEGTGPEVSAFRVSQGSDPNRDFAVLLDSEHFWLANR